MGLACYLLNQIVLHSFLACAQEKYMDTSPPPTQEHVKQIITSVYTPTVESISESGHYNL